VPNDSGGWAFEVKWDGIRAQAAVSPDGRLVVRTRSGGST
jgi:ATP-dependent DNA ligase